MNDFSDRLQSVTDESFEKENKSRIKAIKNGCKAYLSEERHSIYR